ncbi:hypothetical protein ILYODFUR_035797 [Ilyodon furcidens]|uniref:Uncharacterized protein n=1 Tax=Ilyodon furcidens TaxID=33524 RepID=A0ABV0UXY4_9TELE
MNLRSAYWFMVVRSPGGMRLRIQVLSRDIRREFKHQPLVAWLRRRRGQEAASLIRIQTRADDRIGILRTKIGLTITITSRIEVRFDLGDMEGRMDTKIFQVGEDEQQTD